MYKKLSSEINITNLVTMRERGMGNREIAKALGISPSTVIRYIGKQPADLRKRPTYVPEKESCGMIHGTDKKPVLECVSSITRYCGLVNTYQIDAVKKTVNIYPSDTSLEYNATDLDYLIAELVDIKNIIMGGVRS